MDLPTHAMSACALTPLYTDNDFKLKSACVILTLVSVLDVGQLYEPASWSGEASGAAQSDTE